jgi:hypothetical protein
MEWAGLQCRLRGRCRYSGRGDSCEPQEILDIIEYSAIITTWKGMISMRILVLADSHKDMETMKMVVDKVHPDTIVHLGDHVEDIRELSYHYPETPLVMVKGNCDEEHDLPVKKTIHIDSIPLFITHGDLYNVGNGIGRILEAAQQDGAQIILHGHTHIPSIAVVRGTTVMNPGRIGRLSSRKINASFGIIETMGSDFSCSVFFVDFLAGTNAAYWADDFKL